MSFDASEIRVLRQRLGWSLAEMARHMGCGVDLIQKWENGEATPDPEAVNQFHFLSNHVQNYTDRLAEEPLVEDEIQSRRVAQLTHRDLLGDNE